VKRTYAFAGALALVAGLAQGATEGRQRVAVFGIDLDVVKVT